MTRVVVIGGSGHVGTYLVPRLVEAGFDVVNVSRGRRQPYQPHGRWQSVETVTLDREAEEKAGTFAGKVRDLRPDIVIDMICFTLDSARHIVEALTRPGGALSPLRDDLGARPERHRADQRDRAAPAVRHLRHREGGDRGLPHSARRGAPAFPPPSSIPATSSVRAGRRSTRPATSTRGSSRGLPGARSWRCRTSGWRPSTTSMPTTWRRCS